MDISFTGFNNIKIGKKQYDQIGTYCTNSGKLLRDTKHYTELKITTLLTDNETGNDLTDFFARAPKKFINPESPDKLEFHIKRFDVPSTQTHCFRQRQKTTTNDFSCKVYTRKFKKSKFK